IEQKIFHAEIVVDTAKVAAETKAYEKLPVVTDFTDDDGNDTMQEAIDWNYNQIKSDVKQIVADELTRISEDENLKHLIKKEK
ncbi:MAG: conjugal transfer protein TraG, partial [Tannerella sp.]|nr:conjugal transfer protein TraG [Tannerella sp.]